MAMNHSYLVAAARTPIGRMSGDLAPLTAPQLGAAAIRAALDRANLGDRPIDEVIMGNVLSAGLGQAPARQAALQAGLPPTIAAVTINKVCGSGLKAVMLADQAIRCGDADVIVAGGMESMTHAPHLLPGVRRGWKYGHQLALDHLLHDGLTCMTENQVMGCLADGTAEARQISRDDQDAFASQSHQRAVEATRSGAFAEEITPLTVRRGREEIQVGVDQGPRQDCTVESLARLRPVFHDEGTATAGNASQLSDGAAAVVVASDKAAKSLATNAICARIVSSAVSGVAPKDVFLSPIPAMEQALLRASLKPIDVDLIELSEAFASQALCGIRALGFNPERVNIHGGAIALGHPIGASGARILVTLLYAMRHHEARYGLAALCLGGGNAVAMVVECATP